MRVLPLAFTLSAILAFPNTLIAGGSGVHTLGTITVSPKGAESHPSRETYRGQFFDVSSVKDRGDLPAVIDGLRHQIDVVQDLKLSPRVLAFFQTVPIVVDDFACMGHMTNPSSGEPKPAMEAACYGHRMPATLKTAAAPALIWGSETGPEISNSDLVMRARTTGVILIRPQTLVDQNKTRPVVLHELLHAYHDHILPDGYANHAAKSWFTAASEQAIYPSDQYLMSNEKEFFAVTTSVFLSGKDGSLTRDDIKKKQPDYYKYLKWLFEFDPDNTLNGSPVASAD
jgi:hypothetical protein